MWILTLESVESQIIHPCIVDWSAPMATAPLVQPNVDSRQRPLKPRCCSCLPMELKSIPHLSSQWQSCSSNWCRFWFCVACSLNSASPSSNSHLLYAVFIITVAFLTAEPRTAKPKMSLWNRYQKMTLMMLRQHIFLKSHAVFLYLFDSHVNQIMYEQY